MSYDLWSRIKPNDRIALVGTTGSGKSTLARHLLALYPWVVIYDPKHEHYDGYIVTSVDRLPKKPLPVIIYQPRSQDITDPDELNRFFHWVYLRGNTVLYVDEAYLATNGGKTMPLYYLACLAQGRSRGIGVITATQRPNRIPQIILSECEHWFVFRLNSPNDRYTVTEWTGIAADDIAALDKRAWYYVRMGHNISGPYVLDMSTERVEKE